MAALLDDLDRLAEIHPEVLDTAVREHLWETAEAALIRQAEAMQAPSELGMFTPEGNEQLRRLLDENFAHLREVFAVFNLDTPEKRRASFLNARVRSGRGSTVEQYFGSP